MDNVKKLYDIWLERFCTTNKGSSDGPWSYTYPDEFVIWLADKLEELREDRKEARIGGDPLRTRLQQEYIDKTGKFYKYDNRVDQCNIVANWHYVYWLEAKIHEMRAWLKEGEERERAGGSWESKDYEMTYKDGGVSIKNCRIIQDVGTDWDDWPEPGSCTKINEVRLDEWPKRFCIEGPTDQELRNEGYKPKYDANGCRYIEIDEGIDLVSKGWKAKEYFPRP